MSIYKFIAWTSPGLQKALQLELQTMNISAYPLKQTNIYPSTTLAFKCTFNDIFKLMHSATTLTYLNIQFTPALSARNPKDLLRSLAQCQLHPYIPLNAKIRVRCHIRKCQFNHSKNWQSVIETYLQKFKAERKMLAEKKKNMELGARVSVEREIDKDHGVLLKYRAVQQSVEEPVQQPSEQSLELQQEQTPIVQVNAYLFKDRATLLIQLHNDSLHKHGFKEYVGRAPLAENIASAIIQQAKITKNLVIWDPFCGSGTLLLNIIQQILKLPIRMNSQVFEPMKCLPIFPAGLYREYLGKLNRQDDWPEGLLLIGSDSSPFQLKQFYSNIEILKRKYKLFMDQQSRYPPYLNHRAYDRLQIVQMDYLQFYRNYLSQSKSNLMILTNPPWNRRISIDGLDKFINMVKTKSQSSLFLIESEQWKTISHGDLEMVYEILQGGCWTKLIRFPRSNQETSLQIDNADRTSLISQQKEEQMKVIQQLKEQIPVINLPKLQKQAYVEAQRYMKDLKKLKIGKNTKLRQLAVSRQSELLRAKLRNVNLQILKMRNKIEEQKLEMRKQEVKESVLESKFDLSQLDEDQKVALQEKLNRMALNKSKKLIKQEKKRVITIPRW